MNGRRILLGVTGGIAAYKAASLCSHLVQAGAQVDVILTADALRFVAPLTFAALTRRPVYQSLWDHESEIPHIALVRNAEVLAIVPATANAIAKLALGLADDLLSNAALAARIPILVAPAMNAAMYEHPATAEHVQTLRARGVAIVEPETGFLAEREVGIGRLASEETIIAALERLFEGSNELHGQRIVITAGPTREPLDPVRFLSNPSTGTMGIEIAREAIARGATVDLILGPTAVEPPPAARVVRVTTAIEMYDATMRVAGGADVAIATAAVSDWRPQNAAAHKIKKTATAASLELIPNPDILAELAAQRAATFLVGFAAETNDVESNARAKLDAKSLDAIAVNHVGTSVTGFGTGPSELIVITKNDRMPLGRGSKRELAQRFWDALQTIREVTR